MPTPTYQHYFYSGLPHKLMRHVYYDCLLDICYFKFKGRFLDNVSISIKQSCRLSSDTSNATLFPFFTLLPLNLRLLFLPRAVARFTTIFS